MCLVGVVVRRYIDFLILLIPTPLVSAHFCSSIPTFCSFFYCFSFLYNCVETVTFMHQICIHSALIISVVYSTLK